MVLGWPIIFVKGGTNTRAQKITFIGGDERMLFAAADFASAKVDTSVFGFDINTARYGNIKNESDLRCALEGAEAVVLPLPYSRDGEKIFAPFSEKGVIIREVLEHIPERSVLMGGKLGKDFPRKAVDYYEREDFAILNAVPTAESAVKIALEETKLTICGMKAAVLGFGRVGKLLAKTLVALGADVTVFARSAEARAWAEAFFCRAENFGALLDKIGGFDCIFNTVPHKIISADELAQAKRGSVMIELASAPGCINAAEAQKAGIRLISAQSLPGRVTPRTAGRIIYQTIREIMEEI